MLQMFLIAAIVGAASPPQSSPSSEPPVPVIEEAIDAQQHRSDPPSPGADDLSKGQ